MGRGPLAGPVVAACVVLHKNVLLIEVDDSKKLTKIKREKLFQQIMDEAIAVGIGVVRETTTDKLSHSPNTFSTAPKGRVEKVTLSF